jgi:hypothetical protein
VNTDKAKEWLLKEGNQYVVVGEFLEVGGKVYFADIEKRETIPVPIWSILNMLTAYAQRFDSGECMTNENPFSVMLEYAEKHPEATLEEVSRACYPDTEVKIQIVPTQETQ